MRARVALRLDESEIDKLVQRYQAGATGRQLAAEFGVARSSVTKLLRERGVAVRYPRMSPEQRAEVVALYEAGTSQAKIAARFGRDPGLIWHVLERAGLKGQG